MTHTIVLQRLWSKKRARRGTRWIFDGSLLTVNEQKNPPRNVVLRYHRTQKRARRKQDKARGEFLTGAYKAYVSKKIRRAT